nr:kinesin-like protein KIN-7D, mitochondrial [Ipomoea batatas]GMD75388.1 kinesin-like protein KIN-7D, mitochondrial [Ipomoea batatas]
MNGKLIPRSSSSSNTSFYGSTNGYSSRSMTPSRNRSGSANPKSYGSRTPVHYPSADELLAEPLDASRSGESISVTVRFRPMSEREYQRGDENAWYPDGDKVVRNEYNPAIAYAFDRVFGQDTSTQEVYEVAARPVVKAAMEGINGMRI